MNTFIKDLEYSLDIGRGKDFDKFYYDTWPVRLIEPMDYSMNKAEQLKGIDKKIYLENGRILTIDEKIRRKYYGDIFLELVSNTRTNKKGWLFYSVSDFTVYYVEPIRKVYLLQMDLLRMAWKEHSEEWLSKYKLKFCSNGSYSSKGICIPTRELLNSIARQMVKVY